MEKRGKAMKRHTKLWENLEWILDSEPFKGRWHYTKKAYVELSEAYSVPWWRRILNRIKKIS